MPTYEYACEKCGHQFDISQSMKDEALEACPKDHCGRKKWGKGRVKRVIGSGAGLIFKGSGFYITDYRSENYKAAAKKDSAAPAPATPAPAAAETKAAPVKPAPASKPASKSSGK